MRTKRRTLLVIPSLLLVVLVLAGCATASSLRNILAYDPILTDTAQADTTVTSVTNNMDSEGREAGLISAFYGLDDGLTRAADRGMCEGAAGADGMPIIFSHEIDYATMQPGDFRIVRASGAIGSVYCTTLAPADDIGELRTALFAGDYGSADDQPVTIEIVGNILSLDGTMNFKGASVEVTPIEVGPEMVLAEVVPETEWDVGKEATPLHWGGGDGVPEGARTVVRVVWNGGVTKPGGEEIDDVELDLYEVTVRLADGSMTVVTPFAIADLGDGDNNHELVLDVEGTPVSVFFPGGFMTDPNEDLNPDSTIALQGM